MFYSIHWNETCAKQIFDLEVKIKRMQMEHVMERERLLGEVACLKKQLKLRELPEHAVDIHTMSTKDMRRANKRAQARGVPQCSPSQ